MSAIRCLHSCLGTSGQNVEDLYRYTDTEARTEIMEATLRWGHIAPSAPDTLGARADTKTNTATPPLPRSAVAECMRCRGAIGLTAVPPCRPCGGAACFPFHDRDPFLLTDMPHVYFAGNQPAFETRLLKGACRSCTSVVRLHA